MYLCIYVSMYLCMCMFFRVVVCILANELWLICFFGLRVCVHALHTSVFFAVFFKADGTCQPTQWPDKDHGLVCGDCKVLVNKFNSKYKTCNGYCESIGSTCSDAWDEKGDTCQVANAMKCDHALGSSDAICECHGEHVCMYVCINACMYVCMCACVHVCMYAVMHLCMYACMHICMDLCMYVCMHE